MAINGGGKTRTTSAHGPTSAKKPYKATDSKKPTGSSRPAAAASSSSSSKPAARAAPGGLKRKADGEDKGTASTSVEEKRPVVSSILNTPEEIDFPRGGGTNLTQVEVYEAQLEGEKEARDEEAVRGPFVWMLLGYNSES